jgi:hypothetical protein
VLALRDTFEEGAADLLTQALQSLLFSPELTLCVPRGAQLLGGFLPAIIAGCCAQGEQRIDVDRCPMHPCFFQARLHHHFIAAFHDARANGPAVLLILGILHALFTLEQVGILLSHRLVEGTWAHSLPRSVSTPAGPWCFNSCNWVASPDSTSSTPARLSDGAHCLSRMGEVQNAQRIRAVQVHQSINPLGSIHHGTHLLGLRHAAPHGFHRRLPEL